MSDLFHESVSFEFIDCVFVTMARAQQHQFQILTKRPDRMLAYFKRLEIMSNELSSQHDITYNPIQMLRYWEHYRGHAEDADFIEVEWPLKNAWLGVSVENQETADERIHLLLQTPAAVHWISAEPLVGKLDLSRLTQPTGGVYDGFYGWSEEGTAKRVLGIDWVVVGGESGPRARPVHPEWVRLIQEQCSYAGVPFNFKQWGEWQPCDVLDWDGKSSRIVMSIDNTGYEAHGRDLPRIIIDTSTKKNVFMQRCGKKKAGRLLDGAICDEFPTVKELVV
jgi:protein gp37